MSLGYRSEEPCILTAWTGVTSSPSLASSTLSPRIVLGWLAGSPCPILPASPQELPGWPPPPFRPGTPVGWQQEEGTKRLVSSWPQKQASWCPWALQEPPACLPSLLPEACVQGLTISQKSQTAFQDWERGEVRSPSLVRVQPPWALQCQAVPCP